MAILVSKSVLFKIALISLNKTIFDQDFFLSSISGMVNVKLNTWTCIVKLTFELRSGLERLLKIVQ